MRSRRLDLLSRTLTNAGIPHGLGGTDSDPTYLIVDPDPELRIYDDGTFSWSDDGGECYPLSCASVMALLYAREIFEMDPS